MNFETIKVEHTDFVAAITMSPQHKVFLFSRRIFRRG